MREMQGLPPLPVCSAPVNMADFSIFIVVFSERAMRASAAYRPVKSYFKSCKDSSAVQDSSAPGMGFSRSGWSSPGLLSSHQDGRQRPSATGGRLSLVAERLCRSGWESDRSLLPLPPAPRPTASQPEGPSPSATRQAHPACLILTRRKAEAFRYGELR